MKPDAYLTIITNTMEAANAGNNLRKRLYRNVPVSEKLNPIFSRDKGITKPEITKKASTP